MAFIEEVWVDELAGRPRSLHLKLNRDVNVFWGTNGSGKTSLLKILHSALADDAASLSRVPFRRARVNIYSESHDCTISRTYSIQHEVSSGETLFSPEDIDPDSVEGAATRWLETYRKQEPPGWQTTVIRGTPKHRIRALSHGYLPISRVAEGRGALHPYLTARNREAFDDAVFDEMFARQVSRRWETYNSRALATIREVQQQGLGEILSILFAGTQMRETLTDVDEVKVEDAFRLVTDFLRRQRISVKFSKKSFADQYEKQADLRRIVARIREVMRDIEQAEQPQKELQNLINDLYSGGKTLSITERGLRVVQNSVPVPLESLSSGEKQLLQILLEALDGGRNSVIIDEPELSMHVDWQYRLVKSMRIVNSECQLILATHSPEVMANLPDPYIFQL